MNTKENRTNSFYDSRSISEEEDPLAIGGKEMHRWNDSERGNGPLAFEVCGENKHRQTIVLEDLFDDNENVSMGSLKSEDSHETNVKGLHSSKKRDSRRSSSVQMTISDLFEADEDLYTDKNILQCEVPQLTAWYKDTSNGHIVKDICVSEVVNMKEKILIESCKVGTLTEALEEESFVTKKLPVEEFGTRSFLRSFISSFEDQGKEPLQPRHQGFSEDEASESPATLSSEVNQKGENPPANIPYDSKIENGSITFNFKYPAQEESRITNGRMENIKERLELDESNNFLDNTTNLHVDDISDSRSTSIVQCSSTKDNTGDVRGQALNIQNITSDNASEPSLAQRPSYKGLRTEISTLESLDHNCVNSNDLSMQTVDPCVTKKDHENLDDVSIVSPVQYDGESSFSAGGLAAYSGPISHSGSLSLRTDSSATSGRSFAFPILQSEWNSSPVRMTNDDGRHFRKHKGRRSGLLCCRF